MQARLKEGQLKGKLELDALWQFIEANGEQDVAQSKLAFAKEEENGPRLNIINWG